MFCFFDYNEKWLFSFKIVPFHFISFLFLYFARSEIECQCDDNIQWNEIERNEAKQNGQAKVYENVHNIAVCVCHQAYGMKWTLFSLGEMKKNVCFSWTFKRSDATQRMKCVLQAYVWKTCVPFQKLLRTTKTFCFLWIAGDILSQFQKTCMCCQVDTMINEEQKKMKTNSSNASIDGKNQN